MDIRRIVVVVLLVGLASLVLPGAADAGLRGEEPGRPVLRDGGFLARVLEFVQQLSAQLLPGFTAYEGATITSNG